MIPSGIKLISIIAKHGEENKIQRQSRLYSLERKNNTSTPHRYVNKLDNATTKSKANIKLREKTELAPPKLILQNDPGEWAHFTKAPCHIQGLG